MISVESYIAKSPATAARILGAEAIIMSTVDSTLFSLNPTGTAIWEAADGETRLSSIVSQKLCGEFAVSADQAHHDALEFVQALAGHGILLVSNEPIQQKGPQ
ncbi:MAG: PqqD family protein [Acidobacteriota bacterium]|nr:PqqD family protein [Acidobacteriota bacterium]